MSEVTVITAAVRAEARKWWDLADRMTGPATASRTLTLSPSAFWLIPLALIPDGVAAVHSDAYSEYQAVMITLLHDATREFGQLAGALNHIADEYDEADAIVALDIKDVFAA